MTRSEAIAGIALLSGAALAACDPKGSLGSIPPTAGSPLHPTAFGSQIYPSDNVAESVGLLAACGSKLLRVTANNEQFDYFDTVFAAASQHAMRVVVITPYASQPVDAKAYAASVVMFQQRYSAFDPMWEIWNEPDLEYYWGAHPDYTTYANLAIPTATALRNAGAKDVLSGGTSGIDLSWIYSMRTHGVLDVVTGCAVHNYNEPVSARPLYIQALHMLPPGVGLYTTETCVPSNNADQVRFLREMWYLHRELGLPAMIWCEFRDGTAGASGPYTYPYGLVTANYGPKGVYYAAQATIVSA